MDLQAIADMVKGFVKTHPQCSGYIALMVALMLTDRVKLVLLGAVLGLVILYAYRVATACALGHLPPYHALVALFVSVTVIVMTIRYAIH